jgi:hypothetical protein
MEQEIVFNGVTYRLMGSGKYYLSQSTTNVGRVGAKGLHVAIWEYYSGKTVPSDYCIHHKDGNPFNNEFENLECVERKAHLSEHARRNQNNPEYLEKNKRSLLAAQEKAKEWHGSDEGSEWHRNHVSCSLAKAWAFREERTCLVCGAPYIAKTRRAMYCGSSCQQKAARERRKLRELSEL